RRQGASAPLQSHRLSRRFATPSPSWLFSFARAPPPRRPPSILFAEERSVEHLRGGGRPPDDPEAPLPRGPRAQAGGIQLADAAVGSLEGGADGVHLGLQQAAVEPV